MTSPHTRPAAFLDRDGTLIVEHGFLADPERVEPLPDAIAAVKLLNEWGFLVIGVSNQSGVARGYFGEDTVRSVNQRVIDEFARHHARIDAIYYCPHYSQTETSDCVCRKPKRGMVDRAMRDFAIDMSRSLVVGDRACDVRLGHTIGTPGILVLTGYGRTEQAAWIESDQPDHVAESLYDAVHWWGGKLAPL